jgi:hypothetical protein
MQWQCGNAMHVSRVFFVVKATLDVYTVYTVYRYSYMFIEFECRT